MLQHIDHVNLVVNDLPGMVAFYRDVLGMKVVREVTISGDWIEAVVKMKGVHADVVYLEFASGPRIELIAYRSPQVERPVGLGEPHVPGMRHMAFRVDDVHIAVAKLKTKGVTFLGEPQTVPDQQVKYVGGVRKSLVYFHDPEGNLLELCEYRSSTG
jgi:catechol 2,3-dioxygenase-like lactoylglutathione lyase family enzyme